MVDLHTHVLPGLDDGATDLEAAIAICEVAAADGVQVLAATPHVRADYPTTAEQMEQSLARLRSAVHETIVLVPGGEVAVSMLGLPARELLAFGLGGNPGYLLVEMPYRGWPLDLPEKLFRLRSAGITPVLAHPERNPDVQRRPELLAPVVAGGSLVQLTAASVTGRLGRASRDCSRRLLELELAHLVATDVHAVGGRSLLSEARAELHDRALADWLTVDLPRAIVEQAPLPERPRPRRLARLAHRY